jgi:hypothetical protein
MVSRLIWFALFSLAAVGGLAAVRLIVGSHVVDRTLPAAVAATGAYDIALPLPKGDRLPSPLFDGAPREIPTVTMKVAPAENPKNQKLRTMISLAGTGTKARKSFVVGKRSN